MLTPFSSFQNCTSGLTARRARTDCFRRDRKSTRLNSSHLVISYAVFCLKKKKIKSTHHHLYHYFNHPIPYFAALQAARERIWHNTPLPESYDRCLYPAPT